MGDSRSRMKPIGFRTSGGDVVGDDEWGRSEGSLRMRIEFLSYDLVVFLELQTKRAQTKRSKS